MSEQRKKHVQSWASETEVAEILGGAPPELMGQKGLGPACVPGAWTMSRTGLSDSTCRKSLPREKGPR